MEAILEHIKSIRVLPYATLDSAEKALPLCYALMAGGCDLVAITARSADYTMAIQTISSELPEMFVGVADLIRQEQIGDAHMSGARFVVTAGFDPHHLDRAAEEGIPLIPGVMTPSNMLRALGRGCNFMNFYPAAAVGIELLNAGCLAFGEAQPQFLATGNLNNGNMKTWLQHPSVVGIGAAWICPEELIIAEDWAEITRRTQETLAIAHG
ncbi:MAG: bifunctional 4-hydroxy-2-oxoglutarate aldolase/2-dehydro-3-deoxy-phosphogluconate aldolase [Opitutales bacterium]|nr:bifunctional 4-hydroxy-2-oxoglutarate aldolase/2-dehydro-3-deoxy-phosphogluconate aldolase [Opitutales bacterium]